MKNVCFLVTEHPFLDARIFKKEAKSLVNRGYRVTMIVPRRDGYLFDIDGTLFKDRFLSSAFYYEGIKVITYESLDYEKNVKLLLYNIRSGTPSRFDDPLTRIGIDQEADIYHAHEFFSLYSGVGIKRELASKGKECKLIFDSHELDPDPLMKGAQRTKQVKQQLLEKMVEEMDYLITVSESIASWFLKLRPNLPVEVIYNSPPLAMRQETSNKAYTEELVIAFEGVLGRNRGDFEKLIKIVKQANEEKRVTVKIIGGWKKGTEGTDLSNLPVHIQDKIIFTGWMDFKRIPQAMTDVDIGWIDLDGTHSLNNRYAMPNKFFSYLNNGVPVLVNQCEDMGRFIERYNCGIVVDKLQATAEDYTQAILSLFSRKNDLIEMGQNARKVMESSFSWECMEKKLWTVYEQLVE
ncbi:glycosyltransferase [Radiobacillus deserti]|uniref:Glycosyltransferase family 4 protein n=1 Tax=Radiobacillus deserti TaxID=2594883 RepID=A0A516KD18_9BACI|nr:glycosyltransferase [Radiobacillus deserti]QDP39298.1 glycosyltransferase family 4 protein [Radiobacillus deserti]